MNAQPPEAGQVGTCSRRKWDLQHRKEAGMNRKKVIIDCDPGIDDSLAIMLALASPELDVCGITVTAGNAPLQMGIGNAGKVLDFCGRTDIPVYAGADAPLEKEYVNALDTHGADGLGESFLPVPETFAPQSLPAEEFLAQTLKKGDVSVIALGPLTNLAKLIRRDPAAFAGIDTLVSMGGNFRSHGNCSPVAEYNYWEDPDAAALVYDTLGAQGGKITMVGLDVTRRIVLTPTMLSYIMRLDPKTGEFIRKITKFYMDFHWQWEHIIGCVINDPLAVAAFLEPDLVSGFDAYTAIQTDGIARGMSVADAMRFYRRPANARVCTDVDVRRFWHLFLFRILHMPDEQLDLIDPILSGEVQP